MKNFRQKYLITTLVITTVFFVSVQKIYSQTLEGLAFISLPLVRATMGNTRDSVANLNSISKMNNKINVFIEKGMEPLWEKVQSVYGIRANSDWIIVLTEEEMIDAVAPIIDGTFNVLFITSNSPIMNALVRGSAGKLALCLDPQNALKIK